MGHVHGSNDVNASKPAPWSSAPEIASYTWDTAFGINQNRPLHPNLWEVAHGTVEESGLYHE